jgi:hypothetical protein
MAKTKTPFDGPIPGMSLTAEPKSRPWRRPAQVSNVDDALVMYLPMFQSSEFAILLSEQIENGVPLTAIANIFITAAVMEGKHTIDVGILIAPVLIELMLSIADSLGIEPTVGTEEGLYDDGKDKSLEMIRRAVKNSKKGTEEEPAMKMESKMAEEPVEAEAPRGLMARRSAM